MWLLHAHGKSLKLQLFNDESKLPEYAILSHCWLDTKEEILFDDIGKDYDLSHRQGWDKVDFTRERARKDGLDYVWIDTCCIDKNSSAELAEAINSMYRWYKCAKVCYVFLPDMRTPSLDSNSENLPASSSSASGPHASMSEQVLLASTLWDWEAFRGSRWFTRGWTLQELLASQDLQFFSLDRKLIAPLCAVAEIVSRTTGIHLEVLLKTRPIQAYSIAQKMSWAAHRQTTKEEDRAYSLLGIFDVNMPIIYGEGSKAFARLQEELLKTSFDQSIFAWLGPHSPTTPPDVEFGFDYGTSAMMRTSNLLAQSPLDFRHCKEIIAMDMEADGQSFDRKDEIASNYVIVNLPTFYTNDQAGKLTGRYWAALRCCMQYDHTKILALRLKKVQDGGDLCYYVGEVSRVSCIDTTHWHRDTSLNSALKALNRPEVAKLPGIRFFGINRALSYRLTLHRKFEIVPQGAQRIKIFRDAHRRGLKSSAASNTIVVECINYWRPTLLRVKTPYVATAEPSGLWNAQRGQFVIEEGKYPDRLVLTIHYCGETGLNPVQDAGSTTDLDSTQQELADPLLQAPSMAAAEVEITLGDAQHSNPRLDVVSKPGWTFAFRYTAFSSMLVDPKRRRCVTTKIVRERMIHGSFVIVTLEAYNLLDPAVLKDLVVLGIRISFSLLLLPGAVGLPVALIASIRHATYRALDRQPVALLTQPEWHALVAGLPITFLLSLYVLLDSKIYFTWRPRTWPYHVLLVMTLASSALSWPWISCFNGGPRIDRVNNITSIMVARGVLTPFFLISSRLIKIGPSSSDLCLLIDSSLWPFVAIAFNLATLVPILVLARALGMVVAPWPSAACQTHEIPASVNAIYGQQVNLTYGNYPSSSTSGKPFSSPLQACEGFAAAGRYLWAFIGLAVWELFLQFCSIYTICITPPMSPTERTLRKTWLLKLWERITGSVFRFCIRQLLRQAGLPLVTTPELLISDSYGETVNNHGHDREGIELIRLHSRMPEGTFR